MTAEEVQQQIQKYGDIVAGMAYHQVQELFDDLNEEADNHTPHCRELYIALYRRLHG